MARSSGRRTDYEWSILLGLNAGLTADGTSLGGAFTPSVASTITRIRGGKMTAIMNGSVSNDQVVLTAAIGIVSADAFAVGSTAVPDPADEPEYPWLWWYCMTLHDEVASTAEVIQGGLYQESPSVDTKAMRKMKPRESLVWIVQYADVAGAPPVKISLPGCRVLVGR